MYGLKFCAGRDMVSGIGRSVTDEIFFSEIDCHTRIDGSYACFISFQKDTR